MTLYLTHTPNITSPGSLQTSTFNHHHQQHHESNMASPHIKVSWDDDAHKALVGALLEVLDGNGVSYRTPANQTVLVTSMADRGKPFSWEGIR